MTHQSPIYPLHKIPGALGTEASGQVRFTFLLLDGFTHVALAAAIEPMRIANHLLGRKAYGWTLVSASGAPVTCSNEMTLLVDGPLQSLGRNDTLIVVGGPATYGQADTRLLAQLRHEAAHGVRIGALCMGIYALALAGFLDGQDCPIHWDVADGFAEEFPNVNISRNAFVLGRHPSAPGGAVAGDMMIHLITETHGTELGARIADQMVCNGVRSPGSQQTVSLQSRYGMRNPRLVKVLRTMEANLETPLSSEKIAAIAAMSVRQTERLFAHHLKTTPMGFYAQMRLEKARRLLEQTELSVTEVAVACGYKSTSHFGKAFRTAYGVAPKKMRVVQA
ncbi:MAG: GlxA family transcriptional regulator [Albidovulum sp.]